MRKMTVSMVYMMEDGGWERMRGFVVGFCRGDVLELRGYSPRMESVWEESLYISWTLGPNYHC